MQDLLRLRRLAERQLRVPDVLHDYQWEGIAFLYRSRSALLADEMGLGKTVQAAVAMALLLNGRNEVRRVLIVVPSSLMTNWMTELATWAPSLTVRRVQGTASAREAFYLLPIPVLVGSYEQIRSDGLDRIPMNTFDLVVLDEAQRIKNKNSATALACRILSRKRAWALSATPLENDENDVVSIMKFLNPPFEESQNQTRLVEKLGSLMLRRRKSEVRAELPPVIIQDLQLDLSKNQRERYDEIWAHRTDATGEGAASGNIGVILLGLITRLKIICNLDEVTNTSSKLDALQTISESAGKSAKILVFSQFVKTLRWLSERIDMPHDLLTGSMSMTEREEVIDRFQTGEAPRMLLISLRAGGVGLNLGKASHVVVFDRWWNPAVEIQAIYRAHRFDRDEPLHVVRFLIKDSVEERIADILEEKENLFEEVIESTPTATHRFTKKELMQILEIPKAQIFHSSQNTGEP